MAIKIEMLRCFVAVVENGRLSDAADALGRTPSAVSMMLKQFEDHVGAPLFETTRKARLSSLGEQIYHEARRELDHFDQTLANIEGLSRSELGRVRLAVTPSIATEILPPILKAFMERFPSVRVEMRDMNSAAVEQELLHERADIGLASLGPVAGFERHKLLTDPFGVVCRADARLAREWDSLGWDDLSDQDFIANELCGQITDPRFAPILEGSRLMVPNTASLLALVRAGVGITILPRLAVPEGSPDLAFLPLKDVSLRRVVWMATPSRNWLTPAAKAFVDMLLAAKIKDPDRAPIKVQRG